MMRAAAVLAAVLAWLLHAPDCAASVGFTVLQVPDGANPAIEVGVWYPADAPASPTPVGLFVQPLAPGAPVRGTRLPLVVMSHGAGGDFSGHSDTAYALAEAGFVAAAPTHTGDNWRDRSRATDLAGRTRQLSAVIGHMLSQWGTDAVDPARVGVFGFSSGGFTVLAAAGGEPDLGRIGPHCAAHPEFYDCTLIAAHPAPPGRPQFVHDARIRALVVAAPALGFAFTQAGLQSVGQPVQLWRPGSDQVLRHPFYAEAVRAALPNAPEMHVVDGAGHFDMLAPCSEALARAAPMVCGSAAGFDRAAFHRGFNAEVVRFLTQALRPQ